jgi:hypothetical protein
MQQRENQIGQEAEGNERSERIVKDHDSSSLTLFDGMGVGDRKCEEAERDRNHQNVLGARFSARHFGAYLRNRRKRRSHG